MQYKNSRIDEDDAAERVRNAEESLCLPPDTRCLQDLLKEASEKGPNQLVIEHGERVLDYTSLETQSNRLARLLGERGLKAGQHIALCLDRSIELIVAIFAVLKTGAAYVPIDPETPATRIRSMLSAAEVDHVICNADYTPLFKGIPSFTVEALIADIKSYSSTAIDHGFDPSATAYVICTSGTTGAPNAVAVSHHSLVNHACSTAQTYEIGEGDRVLQSASIAFDVAAEEIFPALHARATLVLRPDDLFESCQKFMRFVRESKINVVNLATGFWHAWVDHLELSKEPLPSHLKSVVVGTEQASLSHLKRWSKLTLKQVTWFNAYGPTETTITSTIYRHDHQELSEQSMVPIGQPIANTYVYVLDENMCLLPFGEAGELYIGGLGVAKGYVGNAKLTRERFVADPFLPDRKIYRTGDRVIQSKTGELHFIGRQDFQIKIRGHRVEPEEVERALLEHTAIKDCVVVANQEHQGGARLVAYFEANHAMNPPAIASLRDHLRHRLPSYMVPSAFIMLERLPRTQSGKIERKSLTPPGSRDWLHEEIAEPTTHTEIRLAQLWEKVLEIDRVGQKDDFFDLGGHSLHAVTLFTEIHHAFGLDLALSELLLHPTLESFAAMIDQQLIALSERPRRRIQSGQWSIVVERNAIEEAPFNSLVPIKRVGEEKPFFCVTGTGGNVLVFHDLGQSFSDTRPFYAFQAQGIDGILEPLDTIEAMASQYIHDMRRSFPEGPYHIGGYSGGGIVAFEMARQLQASGATLGSVIVIDALLGPERIESFADKVLRQRENLMQRGIAHFKQWAVGRARWERERHTLNFIRGASRLRGEAIPLRYRDRFMNEAWSRARARYEPAHCAYKIDLILSHDTYEEDAHHGWDAFAQSVVLHRVPGAHYTIVRAPHVDMLARTIEDIILTKDSA